MAGQIEQLLNNLIGSWDLPKAEKDADIGSTNTAIMFAGWSWKFKRFDIGAFLYRNGSFQFKRYKAQLPHPWGETIRSLVFVGDYENEYLQSLVSVIEKRHGKHPFKSKKKLIDFNYEPIEALHALLTAKSTHKQLTAIGGAPQLLKIYPFGNNRPIVIRTKKDKHFLFGRQLFSWEKTEYPILDLTTTKEPTFIYPMSNIPVPSEIHAQSAISEDLI